SRSYGGAYAATVCRKVREIFWTSIERVLNRRFYLVILLMLSLYNSGGGKNQEKTISRLPLKFFLFFVFFKTFEADSVTIHSAPPFLRHLAKQRLTFLFFLLNSCVKLD